VRPRIAGVFPALAILCQVSQVSSSLVRLGRTPAILWSHTTRLPGIAIARPVSGYGVMSGIRLKELTIVGVERRGLIRVFKEDKGERLERA